MGLADTGRALNQQGVALADPGTGAERLDAATLDRRLEGEVEVAQGVPTRKPGQAQGRLDPPLFTTVELDSEQLIEKSLGRDGVLDRSRHLIPQDLRGMGQAQVLKALARDIEIELVRGGLALARAHRATAARSA